MDLEITHDPVNQKFYTLIEGKEAYSRYMMRDKNTIDIRSTYVPAEFRRQGIAAKIAEKVLEFAREQDYTIIPTCSYIKAFIVKRDLYKELITRA